MIFNQNAKDVPGFHRRLLALVALLVQHFSFLWSLPLVAITAGLLGATFPLMCHISVRPDSGAVTVV